MTQEEIQERNEQIAFMVGFKKYPKLENTWFFRKKEPTYYLDYGQTPNAFTQRWFGRFFKFDSNWNELMKAVKIIQNLENEMGDKGNFKIFNRVLSLPIGTKQETVFIAVSDFAKLYNDNKILADIK